MKSGGRRGELKAVFHLENPKIVAYSKGGGSKDSRGGGGGGECPPNERLMLGTEEKLRWI